MTEQPEGEHQRSPITVPVQVRERLTLDAMDAAEAIASGEWTIEDARALVGDDTLVHGLILYAQLLETMVALRSGFGAVEPVRDAARRSAKMWRANQAAS
jgi:hypothetical protein